MRKKIDSRFMSLVVGLQKSNPNLGVRKLALLLEQKHQISASKSTIHAALKASKIKLKKGPKKAKEAHQKKSLDESGLMLLRCIDTYLGFFDYLTQELSIYFPRLKNDILKKFLILSSFASMSAKKVDSVIRKRDYLRLAGLPRFPAGKFTYFQRQLLRYKPVVELKLLGQNLTLVSGVRVIFRDGSDIFCDAKMATIWDSLPQVEYFFSTLKEVQDRLKRMVQEGLLIIGYTKSFDYFSPQVFNFIEGCKKGIVKIQIFDNNAKVLEEIEVKKKLDFILGYYPKGVTKGVRFKDKAKRYSRVHFEQIGVFYIVSLFIKLLQNVEKKEVMVNNVLIRDKSHGLPDWGLVSSFATLSPKKRDRIVKEYLYFWPHYEKSLREGIKEIENSFLVDSSKKAQILKVFPQKLSFSELQDFGRVSQLLAVVFKEFIPGIEPKRKKGFFEVGKEYILLVLKGLDRKLIRALNREIFFIDRKRVFFR